MTWNINKSKPIKTMVIMWCLATASWSWAQRTPAEELAHYKAKYPTESGVNTDYWSELSIKNFGDSLSITEVFYRETLILNNPAQWTKGNIYGNSFSEIVDIEAYSLLPGKKKYKKLAVDEFKTASAMDSYVFYDDSEVISYNYPQLEIGSKVVTKYSRKLKDPHLLGRFYFSSYRPTEKARYTIVADRNVELNHRLFNAEVEAIDFKKAAHEDGRIAYTYSGENLKALEYEDDNPSVSYLSPVVHMTIAGYKNAESETVKVLSSLDDLHQWYRGFVSGLETYDEVKEQALAIVDENDSDYEKIRKIFYWVQKNITYIAFEQGLRGFIPHSAGYVLDKKYGDCKDMSSLLVGMLRSVDIPAKYTWIGSRELPYKYTQFASPIVDNHMIATVMLDGEPLFLDATGYYTPIGFPTAMIQGKESLISDEDGYQVLEVPEISKEKNMFVDTAWVNLEQNQLKGKGNIRLSGLAKSANTPGFIQKNKEREETKLKRLVNKGNNKFLITNYELANVENLDLPLTADYEFTIGDYYKSLGDEIYINLNLDKRLTNGTITERTTPLTNDYKYIHRSVVVCEMPEDYEIAYLPENVKLQTKNFGYELSYDYSDQKIIATKEFYVDYLLMKPDEFTEWNEAIKSYAQAVRQSTVLKKINE